MKRKWLDILVGAKPLPENILERAELLEFADSHHVLGQMAEVWKDTATGKTRDVFDNGLLRANFDRNMLRYEMERVERAFVGTGIFPILVKGASYVAQGLDAGKGRRVSDIDILLHEDEIMQAEELLKAAGWAFDEATDNTYDQNYYRTKMHELPPLRHKTRRTVIDVHFKLLPRTSRTKVQSDLFIDAAIPLKGRKLRVFTAADRLLHS
ncbi:MAG: nucleotidyltransferase family protein, partial [Kordiimonadaceae bacterium]|nr:nucleotidyltransferase family protein [Kordiimonadaceae bacterium]